MAALPKGYAPIHDKVQAIRAGKLPAKGSLEAYALDKLNTIHPAKPGSAQELANRLLADQAAKNVAKQHGLHGHVVGDFGDFLCDLADGISTLAPIVGTIVTFVPGVGTAVGPAIAGAGALAGAAHDAGCKKKSEFANVPFTWRMPMPIRASIIAKMKDSRARDAIMSGLDPDTKEAILGQWDWWVVHPHVAPHAAVPPGYKMGQSYRDAPRPAGQAAVARAVPSPTAMRAAAPAMRAVAPQAPKPASVVAPVDVHLTAPLPGEASAPVHVSAQPGGPVIIRF